MRKLDRHNAIRERAQAALADLYHNATPTYPRDLYGRSEDTAQSWFESEAEAEIDYLRSGGAYGSDYRATLAATCNAGRYKSEAARRYYIAKGMRDMREDRARCNSLDSRMHQTNALWEYISEFGKLYQWGRGGRTLAPDRLIRQHGGSSFGIREDYADDLPIGEVVRLIQIIESFNRHVSDWCASVPEMWRECCADEDAEMRREKARAASAKGRETRERRYWAARGVLTAAA